MRGGGALMCIRYNQHQWRQRPRTTTNKISEKISYNMKPAMNHTYLKIVCNFDGSRRNALGNSYIYTLQ